MPFKRYLANLEKYDNLETAKDTFEKYLPYATAFGLDKSFIQKFAREYPRASWYGGAGHHRRARWLLRSRLLCGPGGYYGGVAASVIPAVGAPSSAVAAVAFRSHDPGDEAIGRWRPPELERWPRRDAQFASSLFGSAVAR